LSNRVSGMESLFRRG